MGEDVEYTVERAQGKQSARCSSIPDQDFPARDCPFADAPIVGDIGIMASRDPVAIDQASVDMLNSQPPLESSCLKGVELAKTDKVKAVYPHIDWQHQLDYASSLGLGSMEYDLITV